MNNFVYQNPTKIIFGDGQVKQLTTELEHYDKKVLLVYGGGSIKRNGVYDDVVNELKKIDAEIYELSGVESNPRLTTVYEGIEMCKNDKIDFILAVGGGSVIDCSKAIAAGAKYEGDVWDIVTRKVKVADALPFGTVLTLAATGSEMNPNSVITNWETNEKYGWNSPHVFPKFSIMDPTYTMSVPKEHTVYGIVDMMSHVFEQYFHHTPNTPITDRMCEGLLRTVIETAPKLVDNLDSYDYRETILYAGTLALNNTLQVGLRGDWASHNIEHAVSAVYDIPHAGGLAILLPNWMMHVLDENIQRFKQLAIRVFDVDPTGKDDREVAIEGIEKLRMFWLSIGAPERLADYEIDDSQLEIMADKAMINGEFGNFKKLNKKDVLTILQMSL
ncbi:iron-containing alcohol dehydrogenase [Bacillus solimangrovi]|uniref:Butanol dehydrogenase n=1 Tax=Bacillus solimangrovi TaxID=1305675 RepID=A0A1E5LIX6_9BACI|nr:iron-containing alcohol dehydrogenase [Bacillus solimangrovi]OEH94034.1 butanol dehydrogenase [Bacillus solimangrovi]